MIDPIISNIDQNELFIYPHLLEYINKHIT